MNAFLTMTDADLKELGVNTFGARRKLLVAISGKKPIIFQVALIIAKNYFPELKEYRRQYR